jgi:drug/metabolite transporter (DMT)-like permease
MNNKSNHLPMVTILSIIAAVCFATQHPMTKPLADRLFIDSSFPIFVIALSMISGSIRLLSFPILLYSSRNRNDFNIILSEPNNIAKITLLSLLTISYIILYIFGVKNNHPIIVALILNTSPLWAAIWSSIISQKKFPKAFFLCLIIALIGILIPSFWSYGLKASISNISNISYYILLLLPIPIIYTFIYQMTYKWFGNYQGSSATAACSLGTGVLSLAGLGLMVFLGKFPQITFIATAIQWIYFLTGTILGAIVGSALYQTAINKAAGSSGYVTTFNLLIPLLSAVIGWGLSVVGQEENVAPTTGHWIGIVLVAATLGTFWKANR